ncbi:leucine-rich repeat-containing protein 45 isoform X4 [Pleuronectes platessa]|uniref:leucine-rich repeat-containing protein 45 isoform X4 n=1 Tax=Pleuronectes platessa TaxID=8262 RepID=UPI00232A64A2|nr:leucine-rich repeat-containing protein 45 isoform X4 [Pleuronectes platessa]
MQDFRQTYLSLCKEGGVKPQESVVAQIQESRAAHSSRLDLSGQCLSLDTCSVLARAFQNEITLTDVSLSDCMLSEEGAKVLLTGLCGNTTLKILDLKGNNLKSAGVELLGTLLACNKTLRRLVLEWNALGVWDEAFLSFCQGLASNSMLTQLDLRNNQINHHGASELALALKHNTTLEVLDLRWNNIGLLGGRILLEALQKNKRIVQLEVAGNNIPSDTLKALERTTGHNSDRKSTLRENHMKTQVLSKEIQKLKDKKSHQVLSLMETIDSQREEIRCSKRSTSIQIGQLQEALNEWKSAVNSITAKLQMTEEALTLSEQKNVNMVELLTQVKVEKEEQMERQSRERKKEQEDCVSREGKLFREIQNLSETNSQLRNKAEEMERWCKSQQHQIFELKQELTNSTAELNLRLAQAEDHLETEKRRSKQALRDMDCLRQKEVEHVNCNLEESERALQEHIFKLEGQRIQLKEEVQLHCSQQKQTISEIKAKTNHQSIEVDGLRRRIGELQQELLGKDQEKVAEVSQVRLELQEQIGHLQAERTLQRGLKEKICALERENKVLRSNHREVLLDKESEMSSMLEKLRLKEADIRRMREDESNRASYLQSAFLTYVQGSPLGHCSNPKK